MTKSMLFTTTLACIFVSSTGDVWGSELIEDENCGMENVTAFSPSTIPISSKEEDLILEDVEQSECEFREENRKTAEDEATRKFLELERRKEEARQLALTEEFLRREQQLLPKQIELPFHQWNSLMYGDTFQAKRFTEAYIERLNIGPIGKSALYHNSIKAINTLIEADSKEQKLVAPSNKIAFRMKNIPNVIAYHPYHFKLTAMEYFPVNLCEGNNHFNIQFAITGDDGHFVDLPRPHHVLGVGKPTVALNGMIWTADEPVKIDLSVCANTHTGGLNEQIASPSTPAMPKFQFADIPGINDWSLSGFALIQVAMSGHNYFTVLFRDEPGFKQLIKHFVKMTDGINFASNLQFGHLMCFLESGLADKAKDGRQFFENVKKAFAKK